MSIILLQFWDSMFMESIDVVCDDFFDKQIQIIILFKLELEPFS
jgi:hypothetical protein